MLASQGLGPRYLRYVAAGDATYTTFWRLAESAPEYHLAKSVAEGIDAISSGTNVFHVPEGR